MWSHFDDAKTSHAVTFITDCKRRARCNGSKAVVAVLVQHQCTAVSNTVTL